MPQRNESLLDLLLKSTWWVSAMLGVVVFILLLLAPVIWQSHNVVTQRFTRRISKASPGVLIFFGMIAASSFFFGRSRRRFGDGQNSPQSLQLQEMSRKELLLVVADDFRRQGYSVDSSMGNGTNGSVDLVLRKDGRMSLVRCKEWELFPVGAPVVRELFGLMTTEKADEAVIVAAGLFTLEAQSFASGKPIRLIDGSQLLALVQPVQVQSEDSEGRGKIVSK